MTTCSTSSAKARTAAKHLQPGDLLSSHDGQWIPVAEVFTTGEYETVYNCAVEEYHTYFVGEADRVHASNFHQVVGRKALFRESLRASLLVYA